MEVECENVHFDLTPALLYRSQTDLPFPASTCVVNVRLTQAPHFSERLYPPHQSVEESPVNQQQRDSVLNATLQG